MENHKVTEFDKATMAVLFVIKNFPPPSILTRDQIFELMDKNMKSLQLVEISEEMCEYVYQKYLESLPN